MKERSTVSIKAVDQYVPSVVLQAMRDCLAPLGGMQAYVKPGQKVLLKPNILGGFAPEKAVTTHPTVVRAAALLVKESGGYVMIGDSPGVQNPVSAAKKAGLYEIIDEVDGEWADFTHTANFDALSNKVGKHVALAKAVADADVIITLPKLKTHVQMLYTGAVKNQFGLVVGTQKAKYHYRFKKREWLVQFFIDINRIAKPVLAIMDAIEGMEGEGPSGGEARKIGAILAGTDLSAVDVVACKIINLDPTMVPTIKVARKTEYGVTRLEQIEVVGEPWETFHLPNYRHIKQQRGIYMLPLPENVQDWLRQHLAPKPRIDMNVCIQCGACNKGCPVEPPAIDPSKSKNQVDDNSCIRCYCCHEFCPVQAIRLKRFF